MSSIPLYDEKTDPIAHVQTYKTWMNIAKADALTLCNVFPLTLSRPPKHGLGGCTQGRFLTSSNFRSNSLLSS